MAKIIEDVVVIKFSKLAKNTEDQADIATGDIQQALEQVAQELVGPGVIVEIERA